MRKWFAKLLRNIPDKAVYFTGWAFGALLELVAAGFCLGLGFTFAAALVLSWFGLAHAETIPARAQQYRSVLIRSARCEAGLSAPVAVFAAQVEQESGWNPEAVSPVGARGLGQFMPATAKDMARTRPDLGPAMPTNPGWAIRALCAYDLANLRRVRAATTPSTLFDAWAMALMAYNGGLGWVWRDQAKAKAQGLDPGLWQSVAGVNAGRSGAAKRENTDYPRQILLKRQPKYLAWGPGIMCEVTQ